MRKIKHKMLTIAGILVFILTGCGAPERNAEAGGSGAPANNAEEMMAENNDNSPKEGAVSW